MIFHEVTQGSGDWLRLRSGIPTASAFENILTPSGDPVKAERRERYMHTLIAERIMGKPVVDHVSTWMDRGTSAEAEAVAYYEFQRNVTTKKIGFVTNDAKTIGASPDRDVDAHGLLEIKVPKEHTHVFYLLKKKADRSYYPQVMGQLWILERDWVDTMSYHPSMPEALVRTERDDAYIVKLAKAVTDFSRELEEKVEELRARGWIAKPLLWPEPSADKYEVIDLGDAEPNF